MDPVQALAIVSLGLFVGVLLTAVIYVASVRPRLLEPVSLSAVGMLDDRLHAELVEQRGSVERLNAALAHHTEQLAATASASPDDAMADLRGVLRSQTDTVESLTGLLNEQANKLAGVDARLTRQDDMLGRLESKLDGYFSAPPISAEPRFSALIQEQADKLVTISKRLDEWGTPGARGDDRLSEHARILAELDREMAAQAQMIQQLNARVGEHTTMLVTAAAERREHAGMLDRALNQIGLMFPLINQLAKAPPRPGQDRLTDIKGIGPVYAGKLYEAGIQTFRQLATMTPEELYTLISEPKWRMRSINAESWIEQAAHLASQREKLEQIG